VNQGGSAGVTSAKAVRSSLLPLSAVIIGIAVSLILRNAILSQEKHQATVFAETQAKALSAQLGSALDGHIATLDNLAQRYGVAFRDRSDWTIELVGLKLLLWVEPTGEVRWVIPRAGNDAVLAADLSTSPAIVRARQTGRSETGPPLLPGPPGDSRVERAVPVQAGGQLVGFLVAVFSARDIYTALLSAPAAAPGWSFALLDGGRELYRRGPPQNWLAESPVRGGEGALRLRIAPAPEAAARLKSSLSTVVFAAGVAISVLLGAALHFARASQRRAKQAQESQTRYREFFESNLAGAIVTDPEPARVFDIQPMSCLDALRLAKDEERSA